MTNKEQQDWVYCKDCKKRILLINWDYHLQGESHLRYTKIDNEKSNCVICGKSILNRNMKKHLSKHPLNYTNFKPKSFEKITNIIKHNPNIQIQEQFGSREKLTTIVVRFSKLEYYFINHYKESLKEFSKIIKEIIPVKISLSTRALFTKGEEDVKYNIQSHPFNVLTVNNIEEVLENCFNFVNNQIQERYFNGSGLSLKKILFMDCNIYRTKPIKGIVYFLLKLRQ
jgi:hypothetical protein